MQPRKSTAVSQEIEKKPDAVTKLPFFPVVAIVGFQSSNSFMMTSPFPYLPFFVRVCHSENLFMHFSPVALFVALVSVHFSMTCHFLCNFGAFHFDFVFLFCSNS
jgi:hypothetical protein